jgi:hypothetical protein
MEQCVGLPRTGSSSLQAVIFTHLLMVTVLEIVLCILVFFSGFDHVQE